MAIMRIRQQDGSMVEVPVIVGSEGKSAYEYAKDGGYTGTEAEFMTQLVAAATALETAKQYTDAEISDLINGAPTTLNTLGEIATAMTENADVVAALHEAVGSKAAAADLAAHTDNKNNPHGVTAAQVGAVPTSRTVNGKALSANISLSAADVGADASGSANAALTSAKAYTDTHSNNKNNPHGVTLAQLGVTATAAELNYVDGVTGNIQTQLNAKAADYSIELYNGTSGNPKPVKFATVDYSTCGSENGVAVKISMVSGHGNGSSYAFMQDAVIRVSYLGQVEVDNLKTYGAAAGTYDGGARQYGDIFWVNDTTNKVVDFYCLMGQYARVNMTPFKRVTYSTGGTITQHKTASVYSSGTIEWASNGEIATKGDIPTTPEAVGALPVINGKAVQGTPGDNESIASMNRFQSDLFVQGDGAAPNQPRVPGFYIGKSASDENRHMDIVSGGDYSYIDFNKASRNVDFDARLLVNVTNGDIALKWGESPELTQRVFNVEGAIFQYGSPVALKSDIPSVPALSAENWIFTLADGSIVTKAVHVG